MLQNAVWIRSPYETGEACPEFYREISLKEGVKSVRLAASAVGMYLAFVNGRRVGDELFAPYWTQYEARLQYQTYDVTTLFAVGGSVELCFLCAQGWAVGTIGFDRLNHNFSDHISLIYELEVEYEDGSRERFSSGEETKVRTSQILSSQIYDGELIDRTAEKKELGPALPENLTVHLIYQEGEAVREQEAVQAVRYFVTPAGERVIDFGQNLSGYVEICTDGMGGGRICLSHAEVLDREGNFYTENLRGAKQRMTYVFSGEEKECLKPFFTWQGFRYVRLDEYPAGEPDLSRFRARVVHSDMKRTGHFVCGNEKINQLYHNVIWGQKSNYIDVPTDCPQRDERLGWTGDAQAFVRTAAINYDIEKFFKKWLKDLAAGQGEKGEVYGIAPNVKLARETNVSAAWGDAAVICPWEIYLAYGDKEVLEAQFESMKAWIEYMHGAGEEEYLWLSGEHYGDWLAMDGGDYVGATSPDYIASAFFAHSTLLFVKAGKVLGRDMSEYERLYENVVRTVKERFMEKGIPVQRTQTAYVLALHFGLCDDRKAAADGLVRMIEENGMRLTTGFVGTPYLLHALTQAGRGDIAYELLFQEKAPSWLFAINRGATTMWEHWDGIRKDGSFWSSDMNSYNHYAYGSVFDWIFGSCVGIRVLEDGAGYRHISIKPLPDKRMGFVKASLETRLGHLESSWYYKGEEVCFEFTVPEGCLAEIELPDGLTQSVRGGRYVYADRKVRWYNRG